jgi:hypothetical protein
MADKRDVTNYLPVTQLSAILQPLGTKILSTHSEDTEHLYIPSYTSSIILMNLENECAKIIGSRGR